MIPNRNQEKVILIGVFGGKTKKEEYKNSMLELERLAVTADAEVVRSFIQNLVRLNVKTYVGKGKLSEISNFARSQKIKTLIFNENLTPAQSRNISDFSHCNVVDRTELILDIFARHASTKQAKLQVEMAQLEYNFTKLKRKWKHLSRIQGGIGFRGPGEKQIEVDRREIKNRLSVLKKKINNIEEYSILKRKNRRNFKSISLVGYTNAGKSTIFKKITNENRFIADRLFATLDSKTRALFTKSGEKVVLTDTIGFINKLPHKLVSSFHSTLLEVIKADLLVHIVDISQENYQENIESVNNVLKELEAADKDILMVFNKCDKPDGIYFNFLKKKLITQYPDAVFISAKFDEDLSVLNEKMEEFCRKSKIKAEIKIPDDMQKLLSYIHSNAEVQKEDFDIIKREYILKVLIKRDIYPYILEQLKKYKLEKYLNK